jgi:hypothetical protein
LEFTDDPRHLVEQATALALEPCALARHAQVLTRKPTADHVHALKVGGAHGPHVVEQLRAGEARAQHLVARRLLLDLPRARHADALEAQVEASDASEQRTKLHGNLPFGPADHGHERERMHRFIQSRRTRSRSFLHSGDCAAFGHASRLISSHMA